jgi:hypothetical protein
MTVSRLFEPNPDSGSKICYLLFVRIRIIRQATGTVEGTDLSHFRPGRVYDIEHTLAEFLILEGYAVAEMRRVNNPVERERRRKPE